MPRCWGYIALQSLAVQRAICRVPECGRLFMLLPTLEGPEKIMMGAEKVVVLPYAPPLTIAAASSSV